MNTQDELTARINALDEGEPDPNASMGMDVHMAKNIKIKVGKLAEAAKKYPDHPIAKVLQAAIKSISPSKELIMDRVDVMAMLENKEVELITTYQVFEGSRRKIIRKQLGKSLGPAKKPDLGPGKEPDLETGKEPDLEPDLETDEEPDLET